MTAFVESEPTFVAADSQLELLLAAAPAGRPGRLQDQDNSRQRHARAIDVEEEE
ncbi:hypothetical protein [Stenotrophomonas sp.]|uniref:hypothetical protein n=1 Tax=Stenotrophomonas sp. TaxID=69392 RepID=UPI0028AB0EB7|nr:hypothetical protein [Stenotrophomonas sp.]